MKEENTYNGLGGNNLPDYLRVNPFSVPEGYFDHLESNIQAKIAEQKLKEQVSEAGFGVPSHYFAQLEEDIQGRVTEQKLKDRINGDGYEVPAGYFEELTDRIQSSVALEQRIASTKEEGFEVPVGYFDTLSSAIINKVTAVSPIEEASRSATPVIHMSPKRNWIRYASVAAVAVLLGIGSYWYMDRTTPQTLHDNYNQTALHEISQEEIVHYLAQMTEGVELIELASYVDDEEMFDTSFEINQRLNDKEIEEYLNYML